MESRTSTWKGRRQIAGKWHIITLQEVIVLTTSSSRTGSTWPTTEDARCSSITTLSSLTSWSNPFTFTTSGAYCRIKWLKEIQAGFLQGVLSRASFRRPPTSGQKTFTVLSLHIINSYAKKRGIRKKLIFPIRAVMLDEKVGLVAGDFNGAAWRRDNSNNISIIEEAFADCADASWPHTVVGSRSGSR